MFTPAQEFAYIVVLVGALLSPITFLTAFVGTAVVLIRSTKRI